MIASAIRSPSMRRLAKFVADLRTPLGAGDDRWERKNFWLRLAGIGVSRTGVAIGRGFRCVDGLEHNISIDDYAAIGHDVHIWNFDRVSIGRFCMIAADVVISNGWHDKSTLEPASGPTTIGHGAWIGTAARIVGSVTVGENAIVGAGALVIRDVPPNAIVAGVPARLLAQRETPARAWHLGGVYFRTSDFRPEGEEARP